MPSVLPSPLLFGSKFFLLIILTITIYLPVLDGGYLLDDREFFIDDPLVVSEEGWVKIWLSPQENNGVWPYLPLTRTSFWIERQLWGENFWNTHFVNVLLHLLSAMILWLGLRHLGIRGAWLIGLLFAIHPIYVQSVGWMSQRKNVLAAVFYLLSLWAYLAADTKKNLAADSKKKWGMLHGGKYALALMAFICAVLSKTSTVMLPVILIFCRLWLRQDWKKADYWALLPFFGIALAVGIFRVQFEYDSFGAVGEAFDYGGLTRLLVASHVPFFYLQKILFPFPLIFVYPKWDILLQQLNFYLPVLSLLGIAGILLWKFQTWGRGIFLGLGAFWVALFPVMGIFNNNWTRFSFVTDHWVHLPSIAILILVVRGGLLLFDRFANRIPLVRYAALASGSGIVVCLSMLTWQQSQAYQGIETIWKDTIQKNPRSWTGYNRLGAFYFGRGKLELAIHHFTEALRIKPDFVEAYNNRGSAYFRAGKIEEAFNDFNEALHLHEAHLEARLNRGIVYNTIQQYEKAVEDFSHILRLDPNYSQAYAHRSESYLYLKEYELGIHDIEMALQDARDDALVGHYFNRAFAYIGLKQYEKALDDLNQTITQDDKFEKGYRFRAFVYMQLGKANLACQDWQNLCSLGVCEQYQQAQQKGTC